ncbi:MAG: glycosyltransferase, partial [Deferribacterales bacterium]
MVFLNFYNTKNILIIKLLFSSLPVFIVGFVEDITKKVSPGIRLLSAAISGMIFIYSTGFFLNKLDLYILDNLFTFRFFAIFITIIAIAGVSNSINIIDGFNGLSAIVSIAILFSLGYVAFKVSDLLILNVSFILIGAIGGFFIWNYPFGKIFLGDGGAYFIGFMIATLSIILVERNSQVSPWFPLLSAIYPIFETLFSMYRRKFIHKTKMDRPDAYHLHQLIYKRVVPYVFNIHRNNKLMRNSATSPFLWLICSIGVIPAVLFYNNTIILITFTVIFCLSYI